MSEQIIFSPLLNNKKEKQTQYVKRYSRPSYKVPCFVISLASRAAVNHIRLYTHWNFFVLNIDKPITTGYDIVTLYSFRGQGAEGSSPVTEAHYVNYYVGEG